MSSICSGQERHTSINVWPATSTIPREAAYGRRFIEQGPRTRYILFLGLTQEKNKASFWRTADALVQKAHLERNQTELGILVSSEDLYNAVCDVALVSWKVANAVGSLHEGKMINAMSFHEALKRVSQTDPKELGIKLNKIKTLPAKTPKKELTPNQGELDLKVQRQRDVGGVGMGVLSDGTPFLR